MPDILSSKRVLGVPEEDASELRHRGVGIRLVRPFRGCSRRVVEGPVSLCTSTGSCPLRLKSASRNLHIMAACDTTKLPTRDDGLPCALAEVIMGQATSGEALHYISPQVNAAQQLLAKLPAASIKRLPTREVCVALEQRLLQPWEWSAPTFGSLSSLGKILHLLVCQQRAVRRLLAPAHSGRGLLDGATQPCARLASVC